MTLIFIFSFIGMILLLGFGVVRLVLTLDNYIRLGYLYTREDKVEQVAGLLTCLVMVVVSLYGLVVLVRTLIWLT